MKHYDYTKLLSLRDLDGLKPDWYFLEGNRGSGKTYGFKRKLLRDFDAGKGKFVLPVRRSNRVQGVSRGFAKDVLEQDGRLGRHKLTQRNLFSGQMAELLYGGASCGYIVPLNKVDLAKENSSIFVDAIQMFFDEFQSQNGQYAPDEVQNMMHLKMSVARGGGKAARYMPLYLCSNSVSLFNPYYSEFGISARLTARTKFLRGKGWVLERNYNPDADRQMRESHRALDGTEVMDFAGANDYMLDSSDFIEKIRGQKRLIFVLSTKSGKFGVWQCDDGVVYVSRKYDPAFSCVGSLRVSDHGECDVLYGRGSVIYRVLMSAYMHGSLRFDSGVSRQAMIEALQLLNKQ